MFLKDLWLNGDSRVHALNKVAQRGPPLGKEVGDIIRLGEPRDTKAI